MINPSRQSLVISLDRALLPTAGCRNVVNAPSKGWLRAVREALGLTQAQVAKRLGMRQQPYSKIEVREARGTVTVETLRKAANALGCDVALYLVPKGHGSFTKLVAASDPAFAAEAATEHSMALEGQGAPQKR